MTEPDGTPRSSVRMSRFLAVLSRLSGRGGQRSERVERWLLIIAVVVFALATVVAWQRAAIDLAQLRPGFVALAAVLAGLTLLVNAMEFALSARVLGRDIPRDEAIRVSVLASAANVLPIPGAVLIRTRALRQLGEGMRGAVTVTTAVGIAWVAAAGVLAGLLLTFLSSSRLLGILFLAVGVAGAGLAVLMVAYGAGRPGPRWLAELALVQFVSVVLSGLRLFLVAVALGLEVTVIDAMAINFGGILSHAAGIFPGGLGIKELLSGIFAGLVGIEPSLGVLMAAFDRILSYVVLAGVVVLLLWRAPELRTMLQRRSGTS